MDIKELKLLGGFDHPNIVRFVSIPVETVEVAIYTVLYSLASAYRRTRARHPS